jgi:hypothetical protein
MWWRYPRVWQAEDASEAEAVVLEEIPGIRQLGTHGLRQNYHWKYVYRVTSDHGRWLP